jgi:glycosyltransferase involved in cell wall biosynthesis
MPVRNGARFLDASIQSILDQTLRDFEFVILDDASTDASRSILEKWARRDDRIRIVHSASNLGLPGSADRVVREARSSVCARMDADDVSLPDRLRRQWHVLQATPDAVLVGTLWEGIDVRGRVVRPRDRWRLVRDSVSSPFPHGSIMFRRAAFDAAGGYRAAFVYGEDWDLYCRLATRGQLMVVPEALYRHRFHSGSAGYDRPAALRELRYRCMALRRADRDYASLVAAHPEGRALDSLSAAAVRSLLAERVWAGDARRMSSVLRLSGLRASAASRARLRAFERWQRMSPRTLRALLASIVRVRDRLAGRFIENDAAVEWRCR